MNLNEKFNLQEFTDWIEEFIPDFSRDIRKVDVPNGFTDIVSISTLGESPLGVRVFIIETLKDPSGRKVGLAKDSFNLIKNYGIPNALIAYYSENSDNWRFSLLTSTPVWNDGKIITKLSNPKRHSYVLGSNAKVNTPNKFLIKKGKALDFVDLKSRFSLEVVNKEFYKEISESFTKLVGGTRGEGKNKKTYNSLLNLPSTNDHSQISIEFAVRLIGRVIFCWFLKEKISESGKSLMPKELLSLNAISDNSDYYHKILEPIFFEVLNKPIKSRKDGFASKSFSQIPYLNGGLFSPHDDDFFSYNEGKQSQFHNTVVVPDEWFKEFFGVLETYNFTIDENTSIDEDLSIDPEMLGRIFENLLAEINPETGESARKSTGSYYTPRVIVDYMVDESLLLYLKQKTDVDEEKLRAIISYDLSDDSSYPISDDEKHRLVDAIEEIKILDPACGSGAYPIGALQKIVFILQQIDPDGQIWFQKQLSKASPEFRRDIERKFSNNELDFLRKIGIIRESIFGIDIQPIATEISRLRCFLTLIVDENINDKEENRGIKPLPNLDFKFVTANSLIGLPDAKKMQISLFDDIKKIEQLKDLRNQYFNSVGEERMRLILEFSSLQTDMVNELIDEHGFVGAIKADLTRKLTDWKPFKQKSTDWFDSEWMFGVRDGFDIVISNPPYSELRDLVENDQEQYKKSQYYEFAKGGRINLFQFFYPLALNITNDFGIICLITQNSILAENSALNNRRLIIKNSKIIQFSSFPERDNHKKRVFEGVKMSVCIGILKKDKILEDDYQFNINVWYDRDLSKGHKLKLSLSEIKSVFPENLIFPIATQQSLTILKKIKSLSNKFYVKSKAGEIDMTKFKKQFNLSEDGYRVITGAQVLQYTISDKPSQGNIIYLNENNLPNGLREDFTLDRIVMQRITGVDSKIRLIATLITKNLLCANSVNYITNQSEDLKYILGILNSKMINFYFKQTSTNTNVTTSEINTIPFPIANMEIQKRVIDLVSAILAITKSEDYITNSEKQARVHDYEKQIDQLVYKLYGLTPEEIAIIDGKS